MWTGTKLLLLGGAHTDGEQPPCPPAASCSAPPATQLNDGAAWDPDARAWTYLKHSGAGALPPNDPAAWSGTQALTRSVAITPDLAAGTLSSAPLDLGDALVYADPLWTGSRLVGIGIGIGIGWGYGARLSGVDGQLVAEVLDPLTGDQHAVPWPFAPPRAEAVRTAWTGHEVVALVDVELLPGRTTTRVVAFNPAVGSWRQVREPVPPPSSVFWDGHELQVAGSDGRLSSIDPSSGATTVTALPDRVPGTLLASPGGQLLLHGERDYLRVTIPGVEGDAGETRAATQQWRVLPPLPTTVHSQSRTLAWAGERLVVWGGRSSGIEGDDTVNTAEGWTFTTAVGGQGTP